jgi:glycosyltransferase involved in cell wall biosynthesis
MGSHFPAIGYIKDFDVGVLGTHTSEHCSNSILEYMACRKPVVATNVGGNPELIVDQETGLLVEPKNVSSMSQAILKLIDNPSLASRMGSRGRERIENEFNIENIVEKYLSLWQEVASSKIHNCTDF